jgi:hypothetical protein
LPQSESQKAAVDIPMSILPTTRLKCLLCPASRAAGADSLYLPAVREFLNAGRCAGQTWIYQQPHVWRFTSGLRQVCDPDLDGFLDRILMGAQSIRRPRRRSFLSPSRTAT